jgi:hypothetical protein
MNDIDAYNKKIAGMAILIVILWITSVWIVRQTFIYRANQAKASEEVVDKIDKVGLEVGKIKEQLNKKTKKLRS